MKYSLSWFLGLLEMALLIQQACSISLAISSVQFSRSVVSNSLRLRDPQHTRPPCPSPTPGVYPNSCTLSRWCHLTTSSSVVPFSSCLQLSQQKGLFKWVGSSHQVAKILEFQGQVNQTAMKYYYILYRIAEIKNSENANSWHEYRVAGISFVAR